MNNTKIKKVLKLLTKLHISLVAFRLKWFFRNKTRFQPYRIKVLDLDISLNDPRSFYSEFVYIFKNEIYNFHSNKKNPTIIDGGSFIGLSCLYFKKKYPGARITIFEPDKNALSFLRKNIGANHIKNVEIIEKGLFRKDGETTFKPDNTDGGKIDPSGSGSIEVTRLSNYINTDIDFVKLNIEGAELTVLEELDQSNKLQKVRELCIEYHSFKGQKQTLDKILSILTRNNFRYYIGNFENSPKGNFRTDNTFFLLVYAQNDVMV